MPQLHWVGALIGIVLLVAGRRLFWLVVAAVGCVYGIELAPTLVPAQSPVAVWLIAITGGLLGAVLAYYVEWLAIAATGFLIGGRLGLLLVSGWSAEPTLALIGFGIGAVVGTILIITLFDWTLIVLCALVGASLISNAIFVVQSQAIMCTLALTLVGIIVQAAQLRRTMPR